MGTCHQLKIRGCPKARRVLGVGTGRLLWVRCQSARSKLEAIPKQDPSSEWGLAACSGNAVRASWPRLVGRGSLCAVTRMEAPAVASPSKPFASGCVATTIWRSAAPPCVFCVGDELRLIRCFLNGEGAGQGDPGFFQCVDVCEFEGFLNHRAKPYRLCSFNLILYQQIT